MAIKKRIASSAEELTNIVNVDTFMIKSKPIIGRRTYVTKMLRTIADSVEAGNINSIPNIQWDGTSSCSGTVNFFDSGTENFEFDLS